MTIAFTFTILLVGIISCIVFWLLFAYPKKYKANINKALNSGAPVKTIEPTILFGGITLITLIILNIVLLVSMNNMQENIHSLQNQSNNLSSKLSYVQNQVGNVSYDLDQLYQDSRWIKSGEYTIVSFSDENNADIMINFEMNRIPSDGIITLIYSDEENVVLTQVVTSTTTIFSTIITIDIDKIYELSVMIDDGTTIENEDLFKLDIGSDLRSYKGLDLMFDEEGQMLFLVKNDYSLYSEFAFEQVVLEFYLNDILVFTETKLQPTYDINDFQTFEITVNQYEFGVGESRISIICTDKLGDEYEIFDEELNFEIDEMLESNSNN